MVVRTKTKWSGIKTLDDFIKRVNTLVSGEFLSFTAFTRDVLTGSNTPIKDIDEVILKYKGMWLSLKELLHVAEFGAEHGLSLVMIRVEYNVYGLLFMRVKE